MANDSPHYIATDTSYTLTEEQEVYYLGALTYGATTPLNLTGNSLAQVLEGNAGSNSLDGKGGGDILIGREGNDTYRVYSAADRVNEKGTLNGQTYYNEGIDTVVASASYALDASASVEILQAAAGTAPINLTGNIFSDRLIGNDGDNILDGTYSLIFESQYTGYSGATMIGGAGNDTYVVHTYYDGVQENLNGGTDTVQSSVTLTLGANVENLVLLAGADNGTGNGLDNVLTGNAGGNQLDGKGGADTMVGLDGSDLYVVDNAGDKVIEAANGGSDTIVTSVSYTLGKDQAIETLGTNNRNGTSAIDLRGNALANTLTGNAAANLLDGKGGGDSMLGLAGDDTYIVYNARDFISESVGGGTDRALAVVSYTLQYNQPIEVLGTIAAAGTGIINLTGNNLAQTIQGNAGHNVLNGGGGADTIYSFGGEDVFVFNTSPNAIVHLKDFSVADDTIQMAKAIYKQLPSGNLPQNAFKDLGVLGATVDADDRIIYNHKTGALSYDADGSGSSKAIQFAILDNHASLTFQDFFVA